MELCIEEKLKLDVKGRIIGVKAQMSRFDILFGLKLCERVLKLTDNLSKTLQTQSLSAAESYSLAKMTCATLEKMRSEQMFDMFFQRVELFRQKVECVDKPSLPRKRKTPKRFEIGEGAPHHSSTVEDYYQRQYFEVVVIREHGSVSLCRDGQKTKWRLQCKY